MIGTLLIGGPFHRHQVQCSIPPGGILRLPLPTRQAEILHLYGNPFFIDPPQLRVAFYAVLMPIPGHDAVPEHERHGCERIAIYHSTMEEQ